MSNYTVFFMDGEVLQEVDSKVSEEASETHGETHKAEEPAKYELTDEFLQGSSEFKELVEGYVNNHGLPVEELNKLITLVKRGGENIESHNDNLRKEAVDSYLESAKKAEEKAILDWATDLSSPEELENIKEYASKKLKGFEDAQELLGNSKFLRFMKKERDGFVEKAPSVLSKRFDEKEQRFAADLADVFVRLGSKGI